MKSSIRTPINFNGRVSLLWETLHLIGGGAHSTVECILTSHPAAPGSILSVPKIFSEFLDVTEIYRQQCSAQSVDSAKSLIVECTHLVLACGKLVLQFFLHLTKQQCLPHRYMVAGPKAPKRSPILALCWKLVSSSTNVSHQKKIFNSNEKREEKRSRTIFLKSRFFSSETNQFNLKKRKRKFFKKKSQNG